MENEKEYAQVDVVEQEEQTSEEAVETQEEDTVVLNKADYNKLRRKALAYESNKQSKTLSTQQKEPVDDDVRKTVSELKLIEEKRQFGFENNLSPEETDFVFTFSKGKPTKEIMDNPFVKSGIDGFRSQKRLEANTPSSSSHSPIFGSKPFEEMTLDEQRKAFEERRKNFKK